MQSLNAAHHNQWMSFQLNNENQYEPRRRDNRKRQKVFDAVRQWESTLPGQAQDTIVSLVAERWQALGGRGITVNKLNLFRYLKNETSSDRYTGYVMQLAPAIISVLPLEIAKQYGWRREEKTSNELVADSVKEDCEAHQAVLLGMPVGIQVKELLEAISAKAAMLPSNISEPLLATLSTITTQSF